MHALLVLASGAGDLDARGWVIIACLLAAVILALILGITRR